MTDAVSPDCPPLDRLESHVTNHSADEEVQRHVKHCLHCRARVDELRANAELEQRIRRWRSQSEDNGFARRSDGETAAPSLDEYEIIEQLDAGGQGAVFRALQRSTNREVALKVLLMGAYATSRQRARFEREIEIVAALSHPGIVTVHEAGTTADDRIFLAMELVDGVPLSEWSRAIRRSDASSRTKRERITKQFIAVADAVGYAHQRGVMHRDLKPSNILVDAEDRAHVLDFGLARPVAAPDDDPGAQHTVEGSFVGTLAYASPEQTRGQPDAVDVRTDVYAIGVMLYESLTGEQPLQLSCDPAEAIRQVREDDPPPPRTRDRTCSDDELDAIVLKALAKRAEQRYDTALQLRDDLRRYLAGAPIVAKRHGAMYLVRKAMARHRVAAAIVIAFVVVLATAAVALVSAYRSASNEAAKVHQINLFLEDTLASARSRDGVSDVTVKDMLDEAVHWVDLALADQPETAASIRGTIANGYRNIGLYETALAQASLSLALRERMFGAHSVESAASLNLLGLIHRDAGNLDPARRFARRALTLREDLLPDDDDRIALSLSNLASIEIALGQLDDAQSHLTRALALRRAKHPNGHPDVAMSLFQLAELARLRGEKDEAEALHRDALAMRESTLSPMHPDRLRSAMALAELLVEQGDTIEAIQLLQPALLHAIESFGADHIMVIDVRRLLARCFDVQGDSQAAHEQRTIIEAFERTIRKGPQGLD